MHQPLIFKLDQNPEGSGLRCHCDGLFLGRDALLKRDRNGKFEAQPVAEVQGIFGRAYREESNWESRIRSVHLVAEALNKGDVARAMVAAVLMRLPDPAEVTADTEGVLAKANFNPDEPRDERGRWTSDGSGSANDSPEQGPTNPHQNIWQMLGSELSDGLRRCSPGLGEHKLLKAMPNSPLPKRRETSSRIGWASSQPIAQSHGSVPPGTPYKSRLSIPATRFPLELLLSNTNSSSPTLP